MKQERIDDLAASFAFLTFLWVMVDVYLRPIWRDRPTPIRPDAPTGEQPWVKPKDRVAS